MTILVLGGTGFIGQAIVNLLIENNKKVTILTRTPQKLNVFPHPVPHILGSLEEVSHLDLKPYQVVINCAGELHNKDRMPIIHVAAIEKLINKMTSTPKSQWIQLSSVGVYGRKRKGIVKENTPFMPVGTYEKTKAEGELLVKNLCSKNKINYTIIRPSNVFGSKMPNQSLRQLIAVIQRKLFFYIGKNPQTVMMNYVHVDDVAHLVYSCVENERAINQDYIISDQLTLVDFVKLVCTELRLDKSFYKIPEPLLRGVCAVFKLIPYFPLNTSRVDALTTKATYSVNKVQQTLGFTYTMGLSRGLKKYIAELKDG